MGYDINFSYSVVQQQKKSSNKMRILMFVWIPTLLLLSNFFRTNVMHAWGECLLDQKASLLRIRRDLSYNSSESRLGQWDKGVDCCLWPGVGCNDGGYISVLDLGSEVISGEVNESLWRKLPWLSVIRFDGINFSAMVFADFKNLTELSLYNCNFSGTIPSLKQSKNLTIIDLSYNDLTGEIPSSHWDGLDKLEILRLSGNSFSGPIPTSLFFLPSLLSLDLSRNKFSGQIIELQNVTSPLENLDLMRNNFEGPIPLFFFQLQNLSSLLLSSNKFNGTVQLTKFTNPENIVSLTLSHNSLVVETSVSEEELPILPQFQLLSLASCNLQELPSFLKNQSRLNYLDLSNNSISGEIPSWLWGSNNGHFSYLNLSHNRFTHMQEPKEYTTLGFLDLHSNLLSGKIPRTPHGALYLDLSNNNFSSMIPLDIGDQLSGVLFFSLANNRVTGSIPSSLCHAANLELLDLSYNTLQGTIPPCLVQNNSNLGVINLKGNRLSGEIPQMFLQDCSLEALDLSQNQLEGKLPPSLVSCTKLKVLNLGSNSISDTFPCWLSKLSNLHVLALRSNRFHGSISCPKVEGNNSWPSLQVIDLASNNFSGILPADLFLELKAIVADRNEAHTEVDYLYFKLYLVNNYYLDPVLVSIKGQYYTMEKILSIFTSIDLSSNKFEGGIPETIGELKRLHLFNISHNSLTGSIPQFLENLRALEALDLSSNKLTGKIPEQLVSLTFLSFLNLSYNHLVGRIPQGKQFNTFGESSFMGNKELCGDQLNISCNRVRVPPSPQSPEEQSSSNADFYISIEVGFVVGLGGIILPLLLSNRWRSYYSKKIDGLLAKIFFQRGHGRRARSTVRRRS